MSASPYEYHLCPDCQGVGCPSCENAGSWLLAADGTRLVYAIPPVISTASLSELHTRSWLISAGMGATLAITAVSLGFLLAQEGPSLTNLFWKTGPLHAVFGVAGIGTICTLPIIKKRRASERSLTNLDDDLGLLAPGRPLLLNAYANERVEQVLLQAAVTAARLGTSSIDESVLLITLLREPRIAIMLARMERSASQLEKLISVPTDTNSRKGKRSYAVAPSARDRIYAGFEQARKHGFPYIDLEDILLAYLETPSAYAESFKATEVTYDGFYAVSRWYAEDQERANRWKFWLEQGRTRPRGYMNRAWTALPTPYLDMFSLDITRQASMGGVPTVTVRDKEINATLQILGRTKKNSALLVGEPGVGKESILGAVALRMIEENVPEVLKDKRLISVDLGALLSSGGSPEQNLQRALDEIMTAGNVILAVPDIHVLVGGSEGGLDAAAILAGALGRGAVQIVSTATYADYHKYVESSANLSALLDTVEIKDATVEQTITVLEEEAPDIEGRQHIYLTYPAIEAAAHLAKRYFPSQALPGSAVSLLDEAASAARLAKQHWVTRDDLEVLVENKTNIPVKQAGANESQLLLNLEDQLHKRIVGQEEAVQAISEAMRRVRAGLHSGDKPIASFLFVGPTGVGKTETAKALGDLYFGGSSEMVRIDMSEYQDAGSIYKLIGPPNGSEGGTLTTPVREHPFCLVLLDELEKASGDILNLFLQLLDDGRLTESNGRTVHYNNAIVIATSNAGSQEIARLLRSGATPDMLRTQTMQILQGQFRPEFLNRFDAIVPFHQLRPDEIRRITALMLESVIATAAARKITLTFADDAIDAIARGGYDAAYGARPLRRFIQDKVEGLLATAILKGSNGEGQTLEITADMIQ